MEEDAGIIAPCSQAEEEAGQAQDGRQEGHERDLLRTQDGMPVECAAAFAGSVEHRPRQVSGVGRGRFLREALEGRAPGVRHEEGDRLGVAVDGWRDDEGSFRGKKTGPNPTDRAKSGTKRSLLVEGKGVPIGVTVSGANTHDKRLVELTLESMPIERPEPTGKSPQNICMDKQRIRFPRHQGARRPVGVHWAHTTKGRGPVEEAEDPRVSSEEMGRRENPLVDEPIQASPDQVGEEGRELPCDATLRLRVDNLPAIRTFRISS